MSRGFKIVEKDLNEVGMTNHTYEFMRFYTRHKKICDQISGIKPLKKFENGKEIFYPIGKENFILAIKKLDSFIIDNIHYVKSKSDRLTIEEQIRTLESDYMNDKKYKQYIAEHKSLDIRERIDYNYRYVNYIVRCFEIAHKMSVLLQDSLMISTMDIRKKIKYWNTKSFFENLSNYRDEIINDISLFEFKNVIIHFKKIIAYHYTYRLMIEQKDLISIDKLINIVFSYLMNESIIEKIIKANKKIDNEDKEDYLKKGLFVKKLLSKIYILTNKSLSDKNILPKINEKVLIDRSLI